MSVNLPAFPALSLLQDRDGCYSLSQEGGVTKRELFAAMIFANGWSPALPAEVAAKAAVVGADALLAELAKDSP